MGQDESAVDGGRRGGASLDADTVPPPRAAASLVLYVHEAPDGLRTLTGGGITADGTCADIFATVQPGGVWNGLRYEDLLPGCYDIVGDTVVRADRHVVPSKG